MMLPRHGRLEKGQGNWQRRSSWTMLLSSSVSESGVGPHWWGYARSQSLRPHDTHSRTCLGGKPPSPHLTPTPQPPQPLHSL